MLLSLKILGSAPAITRWNVSQNCLVRGMTELPLSTAGSLCHTARPLSSTTHTHTHTHTDWYDKHYCIYVCRNIYIYIHKRVHNNFSTRIILLGLFPSICLAPGTNMLRDWQTPYPYWDTNNQPFWPHFWYLVHLWTDVDSASLWKCSYQVTNEIPEINQVK